MINCGTPSARELATVAGVRWQVATSVHLLVASDLGRLPFVVFTPEGLEDLDCADVSGARTHIQMKEVGAGAGD
jgi:hypothetical protein